MQGGNKYREEHRGAHNDWYVVADIGSRTFLGSVEHSWGFGMGILYSFSSVPRDASIAICGHEAVDDMVLPPSLTVGEDPFSLA